METVFISSLKTLLDAISEQMELYVPKKFDGHYVIGKYDKSAENSVDFNDIRACNSVKDFLFPIRELAATFPDYLEPNQVKPFAVFGLKDCDLRSITILDKVFAEADFEDPFYLSRRSNMFIISSDCNEPGQSCFCNLFERTGFSTEGFDLNVSKIKDGFIIEAGSQKGKDFIEKNSKIFADTPDALLAERDENRVKTKNKLAQNNSKIKFDRAIKDIVEDGQDSVIFDEESKKCIECQACTRVCPTCHCFYLYDVKQKDYFAKMKMWDSCMRFTYAAVAGGANPNKVLGDRMKHRLLHKFVYFLDRYGINMCVGCGRCVDADAGGMDLREVLKRLSEESKVKK